MGECLRFGWASPKRRARAITALLPAVSEWLRDWGLNWADTPILAEDTDGKSWDVPVRRYGLRTPHGEVVVAAADARLSALGARLADVPFEPGNDIAASVAKEALQALARGVGRLLAPDTFCETVEEYSRWPAWLGEQWGSSRLRIGLKDMELKLLLDRSALEALCPLRSAVMEGLAARGAAVDQAPLGVEAVLPFGSVPASALSGLSVGDVLVSERLLNAGVQLRVARGQVVAHGRLHRRGRRLCISIEAENPGMELS